MKQKGYWTKERCKEEALKYETRTTFKLNSGGAYNSTQQNKWLDELCSHMNDIIKPKNHWTKERCREEALKYKNRSEFQRFSPGAYIKSRKNKCLDGFCIHMKDNNNTKRIIYSYEFSDNCVHIGLTNNIKRRKRDHKKEGTVYDYYQKNKNYNFSQLTDYLEVKKAQEMEEFYVEQYKKNDWKILNIAKTGSIGSNILKWTYEKCSEEALKYDTRKKFAIGSSGAYQRAQQNKWLNDVCSHMTSKIKNTTKI